MPPLMDACNARRSLESIRVGEQLLPIRIAKIERDTLAHFADASGDHHPIHLNVEYARRSGMPDVFAQGMLGMAWLGRVLTCWAPQSALRVFEVRFTGIMQLGNELLCTGQVTETLLRADERCALIELQVVDQFGEIKLTGRALVALGT
jgi:acyl dehydratase